MFSAKAPTPASRSVKKTETPLVALLNRIRHNDEFPSISKYIAEINKKLSDNPDDCDASDLANVILNDYGLTSKLLKLANSVHYAFAAGKVTTVTRAVVVLGYAYVRMATISLSLFEHFKNKAFADELKEEVICSFWSGILARDIAALEKEIDPEEAFVCAMLSRFGKLVMIRYLPDEYRKIINRMNRDNCSEIKAVKSACGITYEELGKAVALQWNFPPQICNELQSLSKFDLQNNNQLHSKLSVLTAFIKELVKLIQHEGLRNSDPSNQDMDKALQDLLNRYKAVINLSKAQLVKLIKASVDKVQHHAQAMDFSIANSFFFNQLLGVVMPPAEQQARAEPTPSAVPASASFRLADTMDLKMGAHGPVAANPIDLIMDGVQEISQAMMADCDVNDIALMSLEILYRSLAFERALMFIRDSRSNRMDVRFGYGKKYQNLIRSVGFKVQEAKDLFNLSVRVGKDLIMTDSSDPNIRHLIPEWYRRHIDAPAFIFLPITVQKVAIGALYADRKTIGRPISDIEHRHLGMLRNQLVLAIRYRQGTR
jgi:eukaryotic-like serine/threonine-protein kinase